MKLLFTVCGRAGSKGFKNFLGAPLVYYSLAAIIEYKKRLQPTDTVDVVLNTDSEQLIDIVCAQKELPVFVVRRTEDLAGDTVAKVAVIGDCLVRSEAHFNCEYDVAVDLDITSPLRTADDIENAVQTKLKRTDTDAIYSVAPSRRSPYFNMVKDSDGFSSLVVKSEFTARQQAPCVYDMNASIYAYSPTALRTKPSVGFFNSNCFYTVMKDTAVLDIDGEEDFELMQVVAEHVFFKQEPYKLIADTARQITPSNNS